MSYILRKVCYELIINELPLTMPYLPYLPDIMNKNIYTAAEWAALLRLYAKENQPYAFENEEKAIEIYNYLNKKQFKREKHIIYRRTVSK
jgi:hypothetical protein